MWGSRTKFNLCKSCGDPPKYVIKISSHNSYSNINYDKIYRNIARFGEIGNFKDGAHHNNGTTHGARKQNRLINNFTHTVLIKSLSGYNLYAIYFRLIYNYNYLTIYFSLHTNVNWPLFNIVQNRRTSQRRSFTVANYSLITGSNRAYG